jgi:hypothetical protein
MFNITAADRLHFHVAERWSLDQETTYSEILLENSKSLAVS